VRPRHADTVLEPHQLGEHLRAVDNGNLTLPRLDDLRIARGDGAGAHHDAVVADVRGIVADEYLRTERRKTPRLLRLAQIRTRHLIAEIDEDLGNPAHADPADPYEVHSL